MRKAFTIVIDYKMHYAVLERSSFSGSVHLEEFGPRTVASLKQFAPVTFAKAKKSPFIMLTDLEEKEGLTVPAPAKPQR